MKKLFLIFSLCFSFLSLGNLVSAEVSNPYVVDEKSSVQFSDTLQIGNNYGLENYLYDYVGGYLHITFSYTHHQCCTASYPPALYITSADPTATTTPGVIDNYYIFPLHSQPTHLSGLYLYDVQFDAGGYRARVTASSTEVTNFHRDITGLATTHYVALANYAKRANSNPIETMSFTPRPVYQAPAPPPVATTTPVIIVPGIMATKLIEEGIPDNLIWPNFPKLALSIDDSFLDKLNLNSDGSPINSEIKADEILREVSSSDYFEGLFSFLDTKGYTENSDSFENPYDWRFSIENSVIDLKNKIDEIKVQRGVSEVDLVAHSMGGLLVKKYLKDYGGDSVGKFIDIGTPHTGSPKSFKILNYGDDLGVNYIFGIFNINQKRIKSISQNMPSVYQLLPSRNYFDSSDNNYKYYVFNAESGSDRLSFDQTSSYLKSAGRNSALVDRADTFHQEIDGLDPESYGVETYNIIGCGLPTLGQFYLLKSGEHPVYNIRFINGDGTIPLRSAEAMDAGETYYVDGIAHALLPSTSGVKELVASILTSTTTLDFDTSPYANLSTTSSGCTIPDGRIVSFHSPVELHIYDTSGDHVGPDSNGDIENEIGGVVYEVIEENKFAFLPNGEEYRVYGKATGAGTLDIRIQDMVGEEIATTTLFTGLALIPSTQIEFIVGSSALSQVTLDKDGDGVYEIPVNPSLITTGFLESTGRPALVATTEISNSSGGGDSAQRVSTPSVAPEISEPIQSTSPALSPTPTVTESNSELTPAQEPEAQPFRNESEATQESAEPDEPSNYETTAIAYKSFWDKLIEIFWRIWGWIVSII